MTKIEKVEKVKELVIKEVKSLSEMYEDTVYDFTGMYDQIFYNQRPTIHALPRLLS